MLPHPLKRPGEDRGPAARSLTDEAPADADKAGWVATRGTGRDRRVEQRPAPCGRRPNKSARPEEPGRVG